MEFSGQAQPLTPAGVDAALSVLCCKPAELWAVLQVETKGCGFLPSGRPQILFERHWFHRLTRGRFTGTHSDISHPEAGGYGPGGESQYNRLEKALALDQEAALKSASWGIGQLMGFNSGMAGFPTAETMVAAFVDSEDAQLLGMAKFIKANKLDGFLKNRQWASFAFGYNGKNYKVNQYDTKLAAAYERCTQMLPDLTTRFAQVQLVFVGLDPGPVDGFSGKRTREALRTFQTSRGLPATGNLDEPTLTELKQVKP